MDGFDESTADFMVAAIFTQQHQQLEAMLSARSEAEKLAAAAEVTYVTNGTFGTGQSATSHSLSRSVSLTPDA